MPLLSSKGIAFNRSVHSLVSLKVRSQSSSGEGKEDTIPSVFES